MVRDHVACVFAHSPVAECGRDAALPAPILASTWPLALIFALAAGLAVYAYLRTIYRKDIDWEQEAAPKPLRPIEDIARDSGL